MIKTILKFILALLPFAASAQQKPFLDDIYSYIENPQMIELNQQPGHVPLLPYASLEKALTRKQAESSGFLSLNGKWKFLYTVNPDGINKEFFKNDFNVKTMTEIEVPGNWQMQGYGEKIFRNINHAFKIDPPHIPRDYNPVGSYRKSFNIPVNWKEKEVFLHFEGAGSAFFVWVNGQEVGYNQGNNEPAEFNVTRYLKSGTNNVSVMVFMYSDGTYNEDQDTWRMAGIHRSVYLMATPKVHIRDYYVTTDLDEKYEDATLQVQAEIQNYGNLAAAGYQLKVSLFDENDQRIVSNLLSQKLSLSQGEKVTVNLSAPVKSPMKWSDEKPNLYYIGFELIDPSGKTIEATADRIGFKKVEIKHQVLYVNGVAVKLNGVNSHMQHPDLGHAMDVETIRKDLFLMKQFNINCVRTSHYPPVKEYLQMADELGIYIVDETGDEAHGSEYISDDPLWTKSYVERVEKMVLRDRSHPCIIFWSAGNETGHGRNICEVIAAGKKLDPSRPGWMYGGNEIDKPGFGNPNKCEDIIGPRYGTPYELKVYFGQSGEEVDPRPSFMDEYLAATGNSLGGLDEYWDVIYRYPRLMGGAIWDWVSPGLREKYISTPDASGKNNTGSLMGIANLVTGRTGKAVQLSGTDSWVELYRDPSLDITGNALTLSLWVKPAKWNGDGTFISKGFYQFGLEQINQTQLEFYVGNREKKSVKANLPPNWTDNWHQLTAIYNGSKLQLFIDGKMAGETDCTLSIENKPFQVNIGRNPEIEGQEWSGHLSNATFDQVAIFNKVVSPSELTNPSEELKKSAQVWLDFDEQKVNGEYFSMGIGGRTYGMIWPDRKPEPELWQVKKSAQPVSVSLIDEEKGEIEIWNRYHFSNVNELDAVWQIQCEGAIVKQGTLTASVAVQQKVSFTIPYQPLEKEEGKEYFLFVSFRQKTDKPWAKKGFEVAWDQVPLAVLPKCKSVKPGGTVLPSVAETDSMLIVSGDKYSYTFNKKVGTLVSINYSGLEMLKRGIELNVWRAPLANDLDSWTNWQCGLNGRVAGMGIGAANSWFALGLDHLATLPDDIKWTQKGNEIVVAIKSHSVAVDVGTTFDNLFIYTISGNGKMNLDHTVTPNGKMPEWLPRVGIQLVLNDSLQNLSWLGRGPFETYPDRKTGAKIGLYNSDVDSQYVPYLIPEENSNKTDVRFAQLQSKAGTGIKVSSEVPFNFSALNYESDNLSRALYPYQLKPFNGITFNLDYALSGVGCTAISVLNKYRVAPTEYRFKLTFEPFLQK